MAAEEPREATPYLVTLTVTRDGRTIYTTIFLGPQTTTPSGSVSTTLEQTTATNQVPMPTSGGDNTAVTALIVFGVFLAFGLIITLLWWCCLPRRRRHQSTTTWTSSGSNSERHNEDDYPPYQPHAPRQPYPTYAPHSPNPRVSPPESIVPDGSDRIGRIYDPHQNG
ncbi:hypothetical protein MAJ_09723, partial [Metarhizium majus ARSEF 297]